MRTIIIHGTNDGLIPIKQAHKVHEASGEESLFWPIEDEHALPKLTTERPELRYAIQKLLWERGASEERKKSTSIHPPFSAVK